MLSAAQSRNQVWNAVDQCVAEMPVVDRDGAHAGDRSGSGSLVG